MSINSTTITLNNAYLNDDGYGYIGYGQINGKHVKDIYLLNTNLHELGQIFENNGEMNDICLENGQIVTDTKRKAEIKENAKKQTAQYEKEYRENMRKMDEDIQNMQQLLPMFYTLAWNPWHHLFGDVVNKYVNNFKVKKKKIVKPMKKYQPKDNHPKTDKTEPVVDNEEPIKAPSHEEARQMAFDNLLSTLKKDLEPEQLSVYSSLIEILRKSQNGDPESITTLYNSMFQGTKQIHTQETFPPQYIIEPVVHQNIADEAERQTVNTGGEQFAVCQEKHLLEQKVSDKSNDEADKSKDTINQINEEILQR